MRTIIFRKKAEKYLRDTANENELALGIIIGQKTSEDKYYIVHLAKLSDDEEALVNPPKDVSAFENVNVQSLADQWISALKMTPGSFSVLGVFMSSKKNDLNEDKHAKSIKKVLSDLSRVIIQNSTSCEYTDHSKDLEILLLSYSTTSSSATCKVFSNSTSGGSLMPVECKIVDKLPQWYLFESNYELDDVFPIVDQNQQVNVEQQFIAALQTVKVYIYNSEIFIQHQVVDDSMTLDSYIKENSRKNEISMLRASILLTANVSNESQIKIKPYNGTIRFSGIVSSRVWYHSRSTFKEIKDGIRRDILRSLAARIQIYCDGLTDLHSNNVGIVVSEPPRRIYFSLSKTQGIQFSEYIFRGETPSVAIAQAKQILDVDINSDSIFDDLEGLPDDEAYAFNEVDVPSEKVNVGSEISRSMYMLGIAVALLVLLMSILLYYLFL